MENFRSQSCKDSKNMNTRSYSYKPNSMHDLRSYSSAYPKPLPRVEEKQVEIDAKIKKGKGNFGSTKNWVFSDPELQRKKRVASYKGYTLEGKVKGSLKKSLKWIKDNYSLVVHG